jgi:hypothetical protein
MLNLHVPFSRVQVCGGASRRGSQQSLFVHAAPGGGPTACQRAFATRLRITCPSPDCCLHFAHLLQFLGPLLLLSPWNMAPRLFVGILCIVRRGILLWLIPRHGILLWNVLPLPSAPLQVPGYTSSRWFERFACVLGPSYCLPPCAHGGCYPSPQCASTVSAFLTSFFATAPRTLQRRAMEDIVDLGDTVHCLSAQVPGGDDCDYD